MQLISAAGNAEKQHSKTKTRRPANMNKWLPIVIATALGTGAFAQEAPPAADLQSQINELRQMIKAQKDELYKQKVELDTVRVAKADKSSVPKLPTLSFGDNVQGLKLTGDLRLRYEMRDLTDDAKDQRNDRVRSRVRLGAVWQVPSANWEIGVGLATNTAATGDATSTNSTWSENSTFEPMAVRFDYAYAKHLWKLGETESHLVSLTLGQAKNPYKNAGILWDGDVNPIGVTLQYENPTFFTDKLGVFATTGIYQVASLKDTGIYNQAQMIAAQTGLTYGGKDDPWRGTLAIGGYAYSDETLTIAKDNKGAALDSTGTNKEDFKYTIVQIYGDLTRKFSNGLEIGPYADAWINIGADDNGGTTVFGNQQAEGDNAYGYVVGLKGKYKKFSASADYVYSGAYAGFWPVQDSDFGNGVTNSGHCRDVNGYRLKLGYDLYKNLTASVSYMMYDANHRTPASNKPVEGQLWQFDIVYKF
jgi:hypothetical protein